MKVLVGPNSFHLEKVIDELRPVYPDITFSHCNASQNLSDEIRDAGVYLGWLGRGEFNAANQLEWVQSPSTGVDKFLTIPELRDGSVILTSARGTHGPVLAEHTMAMILSFTRGIHLFAAHQKDRVWQAGLVRPTLSEIRGTVLGIVGFGTIGRAIAERATAFGMRIRAVDVQQTECPDCADWVGGLDRIDELLSESDIVVVTVPYTKENYHMIDNARISNMQPHAILVGISRGGIIDEVALEHALREKKIKAAALDVFEVEPLPEESTLWELDNLLITPHVGGGSQYEAAGILDIFRENLQKFVAKDFPLRNQIDKIRGF